MPQCWSMEVMTGALSADAGLLKMEGVGHLHGWQWLFLVEGALTVLMGIYLATALASNPSKVNHWAGYAREQEPVIYSNAVLLCTVLTCHFIHRVHVSHLLHSCESNSWSSDSPLRR